MNKFHIVFLILLSFISCEKDNTNIDNNERRIKQIAWPYTSDIDKKIDFTYTEGKVCMVEKYLIDEKGNKYEGRRAECEYFENEMSISWFSERLNWEFSGKTVYSFDNNNIVEEREYDFNGNLHREIIYSYSGDKLTQYFNKLIIIGVGADTIIDKADFLYSNELLSEIRMSTLTNDGNYFEKHKILFDYSNGRNTRWIKYTFNDSVNWVEFDRNDYHYIGDKISRIDNYDWNNEFNNWNLSCSREYLYDKYGCCQKEIVGNHEVTYVYENGKGNGGLVYYSHSLYYYRGPTFKEGFFQCLK